ncbi:AcrR family transcriptional regulator [Pullulanibacillus pueri]|uniref:TetR family transcriptional regulator n=1 Tax=Pullulanibacillus pueri TaxID=1437324 RepID=A0A8J2ZT65_9BACL|nr:TetR/AcrR family transcriptional regulator [Pullulanibacillus pueri]MBM7680308.1 AcrR family transcriptional regulator [Pullulanibacillus pueri]GGH75730.1 TetR family transcriptional regulator [Pullulanibacillus pueri]
MKEKKKKIIESAIKLFAEHGFHSTSVQEIAKQADMSKGSVYLYFESKEDILLNIFYYYSDKIRDKILSAQHLNLEPKEKLIRQLKIQMEELYKHHDFFIMLVREQALSFNTTLEELVKKIRLESFEWLKESILSTYGDRIAPYIIDLCILLDGLTETYFKLLIIDHIYVNIDVLSRYIILRFDDIVEGLVHSGETPILTEEMFLEKVHHVNPSGEITFDDVTQSLKRLKKIVQLTDDEELIESLEIIEREVKKDQPKSFLIQGMLANIQGIPSAQKEKKVIANYFNIKCI